MADGVTFSDRAASWKLRCPPAAWKARKAVREGRLALIDA
jgi:hypothetical protein